VSVRLSFAHLNRRFPGPPPTLALEDISFVVEPASFTAMVGPSGCGKSTLLHIAAGLDSQYDGTFERVPEGAKVACLFQSPRLLPWLTARRNVTFILESCGWNRGAALARAEEVLELVGLGAFHDRFPSQLSGGMQQRVSLARALAVEPAVLLMDEPFAALDELTARRMREELLQICAANELTVLFVTHNIYEACYLADRVLVMSAHPGTIVADVPIGIGRPRVYSDPRLAEFADHVYSFIQDGTAPAVYDGD